MEDAGPTLGISELALFRNFIQTTFVSQTAFARVSSPFYPVLNTCHDPEGWGPYSEVRDTDLTPCFETGIALALPCVFLLISGTIFVGLFYREKKKDRGPWSDTLLRWKLVLLALALLASLVHLVLATLVSADPLNDQYTHFAVLMTAAASISAHIMHISHTRTRRASDVLLAFWTMFFIASVPRIRTVILLDEFSQGKQLALFVSYLAYIALSVPAFILECFGPEWKGPSKYGQIRLEDQIDDSIQNENPALTANLFSRVTFSYMTPLMKLGASRYLQEEDIFGLAPEDHADALCDKLEANWIRARESAHAKSTPIKKHKASLYIALARSFGGAYLTAGVFKLGNDLLAFAQPQLLRLLLKFVASYRTESPDPPIRGVVIALVMLLAAVTQTALVHQYFDRAFAVGMRVKVGIITLLYKKSLVISNGERAGRATGDIVNLQSVDAGKLGDLCQYGQMLWSAPVQVTAAFVSLWFLLGWPAFCGVSVMVLSLPLNTMLAKYQKSLQVKQMKIKDKRTRLMNEILSNMRSIKLYAWEPSFTEKILEVRNNQELRMTRRIGILSSISNSFMTTVPILVAFSTFTAYAYLGPHPLTSDIIFPAISLFSLLQFPLAMFPNVLSALIESIVSEGRLVSFLDAAELQQDARTVIQRGPDDPEWKRGEELVTIKDGEFRWNENSEPTLQGINVSVRKGELLAVLGRVGDGKTSLLASILGELTRSKGEVVVKGSVAYFSQQTFVLSATVKENILFGHVYDEEFYERVLDACALRPDLAILPQGDQTEIGEKGVSLSGGQRARIALARAVYARADIYILDDPLSAVDNHVAAHLFKHVIGPKGLLRSKARILCTNSVAFLAQTDQLLMLRAGRMIERTTYLEVMARRESPLFTLITGLGKQAEATSDDLDDAATAVDDSPSTPASALSDIEESDESIDKKKRRMSIASFREARLLTTAQSKEHAIQDLKESARPKEVSEKGKVKTDVYWRYISAASPIGVMGFMIAIAGAQALSISGNLVLSGWTSENLEQGKTSRVGYHLFLYGMCGFSSSLCALAASLLLWVYCAIRSSRRLHDAAFASLMKSPMSFFELTPQGRIMNLFSRDIYVIDEVLIRVFSGFFRTLASVAGVVFIIAMGAPIVLVAVIPLFFMYRSLMRYYLATSRELKRYDSTSRAPIFSWFGESLNGLTTIRAYGQQARFIASNEARLDRNQTCYFPSVTVNRWVAVRLELVGSLIMFMAALASVWALASSQFVDAGLVGLMMSYAISVTSSLNWVVRTASEVETNIVSVERVMGYTALTSEAPAVIEETKPERSWPAQGRVEFRNYSARYRPELDLCVKNVSLDIRPGEKIGVCGRTGAGKSSLTLALFRIIEPAEGTIFIDDVDISKIGLHTLRSAVSIIPQDPQLFEGTIRENVDPVSEHSDVDIWNALTQAHLRPHIESMEGKLSAVVAEGGQNLSSGQKQLICFARALLRKSKILVLDEATSAIDLETDAAVQEILRGKDFHGITTITIAHRLDTIINSDRVIVMNEGRVAEFDPPAKLLSQADSIFSALCASAGLGMDSLTKPGSQELHKTFI